MSEKRPSAKRARVVREDPITEEDETIVKACPPTMHPDDFEHLKALDAICKDRNMLRLLPMPKAAYGALGLKEPGTASLVETAQNCFAKTMREHYSTSEVEVRDLRETHTAADFPEFYTGPAHPHMLPEGGARVIVHSAAEEDDESMTRLAVPGCAGGPAGADHDGAAAGAGAY